MTDTAAPSIPLFRRRSTLELLALDPEREIGAGGEAVVYHVPGDTGLVAKIYHDPAIERARKLALMLAHPPALPEGTSIAWPVDVLLHERGFAGFVMPFAEGPRVFEFYNPVTRRAHAPGFHFGLLHRAGQNLAAAFDALHAAGYVVGDVNESNLLVSPSDARVTLVDADSLQVRDPSGGIFRSKVGKAEFTPPELQGVSFGDVDREPEHDRFGLAVLLFLLLMEGTHPFASRLAAGGETPPVEERIRRGLFPHASGEDEVHPPRLSPPFDALDAEVREMFVRAFVAGYSDPTARPAAAEWRDALEAAEGRLVECGANPLHRFAPHLGACPWCERARLLGGRDPFPVGAPVSVPVPRPRPRRRLPATSPFATAAAAPAAPKVSPYGVHKPLKWLVGGSGPGPVLNPLTFIPAAAVFAFVGTPFLQLAGILGLFACLVTLIVRGFGKASIATFFAAVIVLVASVVTVGQIRMGPDYEDYDESGMVLPVRPTPDIGDAGSGDVTTVTADEPPETDGGPGMADFLLDDIVSDPISASTGAAVPPLPDDVADDVAPVDGYVLRVPYVETRPVLANRPLVAEALATLVHATAEADGAGAARPDTVVFWLRIDEHGQVNASQVISSTHRAARYAASAAVPFLRYTPAEQNGEPVSVWVAQRMVIVP